MKFSPGRGEAAAASIVAVVLFAAIVKVLTTVDWKAGARPIEQAATVRQFGSLLLQEYLVPFEAASILLLVVMIGAAYLARPEK
jgi:NADH:ubiquinone oxidoreductase subunit 6 (subunit J)